MNLTDQHRKQIAQKIVNNFEDYEYEIDNDKKTIIVKDNIIYLKISENDNNKIELKINDSIIEDQNEFWDGFYSALENYIENDINNSKYQKELQTLQKLNEYLSS